MESFKSIEPEGMPAIPDRYKKIDELNARSFLLNEGSSLQVVQSLHSAGAPRDVLSDEYADRFAADVVERAHEINRVELAGNMSPLNGYGPTELTQEQRIEDAKNNISDFLHQNAIDPEHVRILRPERDYSTPLAVVDLDNTPLSPDDTGILRPDKAGDMTYTYDPKIILAARPADCPIVFISAETPKGTVTVLLHLAWLGIANEYVQQAKGELDKLNIDWPSAQVQITAGGHGDTYTFEHFDTFNPAEKFPNSAGMFVDMREHEDDRGNLSYDFGVDVAAEVYEQVCNTWDVIQHNVFADTSDTTAPESGYSSHSRSFKNYDVHGDNSRDLVLARRMQSPNL